MPRLGTWMVPGTGLCHLEPYSIYGDAVVGRPYMSDHGLRRLGGRRAGQQEEEPRGTGTAKTQRRGETPPTYLWGLGVPAGLAIPWALQHNLEERKREELGRLSS